MIELERDLLGRLVVVDLKHSDIAMPDHSGQIQDTEFLCQPCDCLVSAVVKVQIVDICLVAELAEVNVKLGRRDIEAARFVRRQRGQHRDLLAKAR